MSRVEKLEISEPTLAAQPRRSGPAQPWATPRVQGTAVWASSPERARRDFQLPLPWRLARPFRAGAGNRVCLLTQADGLDWDRPPLRGLNANCGDSQTCFSRSERGRWAKGRLKM